MEKAIKKAIEGGYEKGKNILDVIDGRIKASANPEMLTLDPLFWQALGKAEGWGSEKVLIDEKGHPKEWLFDEHCSVCGEVIVDQEEGCTERCETDNTNVESWLYHWHRLIDHLAEGKSVDEFFNNLLK